MPRLEKLQTNIPRTGTLTAVYYAKSKNPEYGDQIKVSGRWEREGDGFFWLPLPVIDAFTDAGLVQYGGVKDGEPTWKVLHPTQRIAITRREGERNRKLTEVIAIDLQGNAVTLPPQPRTVLPTAEPVAVPAAAPAIGQPPAVPVAPAAPAVGVEPASAPPAVDPRAQIRERWAELDERYGAAIAIAAYRLHEALGPDVDPAVIQAGAATVLIETQKLALQAPPGLARALRERANGHLAPAASPMDDDESFDAADDDLPF
ncbi:MAG TPA: hypothetical protein VNL98_06735 [Gemmatimonadales bacterium]|nr:hypothetical protein [Gemmatimonadales bacterium]